MTFTGGTAAGTPPLPAAALSHRCPGYDRPCGVWTTFPFCQFCEVSRARAEDDATDRPIFEDPGVVLRWCHRCQEWWPDDDEFFYTYTYRDGRPRGSRVCRACHLARKRREARTRAAA